MDKRQNTATGGHGGGNDTADGELRVIRAGQGGDGPQDDSAPPPSSATRRVLRAGEETMRRTALSADSGTALGEGIGTEQVLTEWTRYAGRALERNAMALGDLMLCRTPSQLMEWQRSLLVGSVRDWLHTGMTVYGLSTQKTMQTIAADTRE